MVWVSLMAKVQKIDLPEPGQHGRSNDSYFIDYKCNSGFAGRLNRGKKCSFWRSLVMAGGEPF